MKNLKGFLILSFLLLAVLYYSCDDSGVTPPNLPTGKVALTPVNLKNLNQSDDGIFQLWAYFDSAAPSWVSLGRFNIDANGGIISETGGSMTFSFGADTLRMSKMTVLLISIEAPGVNNPFPGPSHLVAASITNSNFYLDSISATLTMADANALGAAGSILMSDTALREFFYIASPTTNNVNCSQGLWFCDAAGNSSFPPALDLTANPGWFYKLWVLNNVTNTYIFCGSFTSFVGPDNDSAGACRGPIDTFYNAPGQDFIQSGGGCTAITNLNDGNHGTFISLEPRTRSNNSQPFFLEPYTQPIMSGGCNLHQITKQYASLFPRALVRISKVR